MTMVYFVKRLRSVTLCSSASHIHVQLYPVFLRLFTSNTYLSMYHFHFVSISLSLSLFSFSSLLIFVGQYVSSFNPISTLTPYLAKVRQPFQLLYSKFSIPFPFSHSFSLSLSISLSLFLSLSLSFSLSLHL